MATLKDLNGTYALDAAHSRIGFAVKHAMISTVRGSFTEAEGTATTGAGLQDAHVEVSAKVASIDTRMAARDEHLRGGEFFDAETYPNLTFRSTEVTATDDDTLRVTGDLTIKDATRPVTFDLEFGGQAVDPYGNERIGFEGRTTINRKDFGLSWNAALETGGVMVGEKVTLELELELVKQA